jgi:hypothetical protein
MGQYVVLGEGDRDKAFLENLCLDRQIAGLTIGFVGGNGGFGGYLLAMSAAPGFTQCKAILLMSDNDESAADSFNSVRDQVKGTNSFPVPAHPLEMFHKQGKPSLAVLMQPHPQQGPDSRGCLETLLIPAMQIANPVQAACVDQMLTCAGVNNWAKKSAQDKARVRSLISAAYQTDPMHGLHLCFAPTKGLIPLNQATFDETALVLEHFATWSSSDVQAWIEWRRANNI